MDSDHGGFGSQPAAADRITPRPRVAHRRRFRPPENRPRCGSRRRRAGGVTGRSGRGRSLACRPLGVGMACFHGRRRAPAPPAPPDRQPTRPPTVRPGGSGSSRSPEEAPLSGARGGSRWGDRWGSRDGSTGGERAVSRAFLFFHRLVTRAGAGARARPRPLPHRRAGRPTRAARSTTACPGPAVRRYG